jgi:asparagine synthase (glutamine-hydrolysing)
MCGIAGILTIDNSKINKEDIIFMTESISHRGPDGNGFWFHENQNIGFGHTRLSILDLTENGKQPMIYLGGRYTITFNGEIFNFIELKEYLGKQGFQFTTDTDTEVILAAYHFWGKSCLDHFNGMWAFAIWDDVEKELFLARDHFGIKPLYYTSTSNFIAFGSETNQFQKLSIFKRDLNNDIFLNSIINPQITEGNGVTIWEDIKSILPGHFMSIKDGKQEIKKWWSTFDYNIQVANTYENQVEEFRELFFDSLKLRLRSDVSIGTALSGGVDSSSVYSAIKHLSQTDSIQTDRMPKDWQTAYVASFPGTQQDETEFAEAVIKSLNGDVKYCFTQSSNLIDELIIKTKKFENIYSTPINVISMIYESMRRDGIVVSMDGHGVDEMMYGYHGLQLDLAKESYLNGENERAYDLIETYVNLYDPVQHQQVRETAMKYVFNKITLKYKVDKFTKKVIIKLNRYKKTKPWLVDFQRLSILSDNNISEDFGLSKAERSLYNQFHGIILPVILRNFDKASMMSGVEIRMPFLDHRLVSYVFKLPVDSKIGAGFTKRILRDSMKGILTEKVRNRKSKIGLNAPWNEWMDGVLKEFLLDEVHSSRFLNTNLWNSRQIQQDLISYYQFKNKNFDKSFFWKIVNAHILINK